MTAKTRPKRLVSRSSKSSAPKAAAAPTDETAEESAAGIDGDETSPAVPAGPSLRELGATASAATNWDVTVAEMSASAFRDGLAPITVHRSTSVEAVEHLTTMLLSPDFVPARRTPAPVVVALPGADTADGIEDADTSD